MGTQTSPAVSAGLVAYLVRGLSDVPRIFAQNAQSPSSVASALPMTYEDPEPLKKS